MPSRAGTVSGRQVSEDAHEPVGQVAEIALTLVLLAGAGFGMAMVGLKIFPIVIIVLYAFNPSNIQSWPLSGLSTRWFSTTFHNAEMRQALWLSVRAGLIATALALCRTVGVKLPIHIR